MLVVENGTPLHLIEDAGGRIATVGTPILGYVFNRARVRGSRYGYRYGYSYGYRRKSHYYEYGDEGRQPSGLSGVIKRFRNRRKG